MTRVEQYLLDTAALREMGKRTESLATGEELDDLLDKMDRLWWSMTDGERAEINEKLTVSKEN